MKIRNRTTGAVFPATPRLVRLAEQRKDIELIDDGKPLSAEEQAEVEQIRKNEPVEGAAKAGAKAGPESTPNEGTEPNAGECPAGTTEPDKGEETAESELDLDALKAQVENIEGEGKREKKNNLETLILENFGVNLDKRDPLEKLQAQALELIAGAG